MRARAAKIKRDSAVDRRLGKCVAHLAGDVLRADGRRYGSKPALLRDGRDFAKASFTGKHNVFLRDAVRATGRERENARPSTMSGPLSDNV